MRNDFYSSLPAAGNAADADYIQSVLCFSTSYEDGRKRSKLFPMLILHEVTGAGAAISTGLFTSSVDARNRDRGKPARRQSVSDH